MEAEEVQKTAADGSRVWLPVIIDRIAHSLPANEVACTLRLVDKATSLQLEDFNTVRLSRPSPLGSFKQRWGSPDAFRGLTQEQRMKLLCYTAASGSICNLEVALASAGLLPTHELLEAAAEAGQLEVCMWLLERGCPCDWDESMAMAKAARGGHRHVCELLLERDPGDGCLLDAVYSAAHGGHEGLMHWLLQRLREDNTKHVDVGELLRGAAMGFSLPTLQRLHQQLLAGQQQQGGDEVQPPPGLSRWQQGDILAAAAGSPTADWQAKVQWLEGLGYPRTACSSAWVAMRTAGDDTVGRLRWLHSRGYTLDWWAAENAACYRNLAALRFLVEQAGVRPTSVRSTGYAERDPARSGHLEVLQYLHASSLPLDATNVASLAAENGHMPVVAWAVEALGGVNPGNAPGLFCSAAESGNTGLMTWLLERGWNWNKYSTTATDAVTSGCEEALEWLVARGCPWQADGDPYVKAAQGKDLDHGSLPAPAGLPLGTGSPGGLHSSLHTRAHAAVLVGAGLPGGLGGGG